MIWPIPCNSDPLELELQYNRQVLPNPEGNPESWFSLCNLPIT